MAQTQERSQGPHEPLMAQLAASVALRPPCPSCARTAPAVATSIPTTSPTTTTTAQPHPSPLALAPHARRGAGGEPPVL